MIKLYHDDCFNVLSELENESIFLIIVDPPYAIARDTVISRKETKDIDFNFGEWDLFESDEAFEEFTNKWFKECARVLRKEGWMYVFFDHAKLGMLEKLSKENGIMMRTLFTWIKSNPAPSYRKYNWISSTESVWVGSKGKCRIPNFLTQTEMKNYMITSCRSNYGVSGHPTEKPLELIERFVLSSSLYGDTVLDCFMGSGTTGVACVELERDFIGVDKEPKWFSVARKRIMNTKPLYIDKTGDGNLI